MASRYRLYHIGFLPHSKVSFDGTRGNSKFSTDTHRIGSGELTGQSRQHLLGLRGGEVGHGGIVARQAGDDLLGQGRQHLATYIVAHEMGEVITVGNELREVLLYEA